MRILQLTNKPPAPPNDGSSIAMYNMAKGFIDNGADLTLLTINTKKHFKPDSSIDPEFMRASNYRSVYRNTDVSVTGALMNLFSGRSYFASRFFFREFEEALTQVLKEKEFDIVQLESIFMGEYIPVIRRHSKAKIAVRTHNIEHMIWQRMIDNEKNPARKKYLSLQNARLRVFEYNVLKDCDAIIPITAVDQQYFESWNIAKPYFASPTGLLLGNYRVDHGAEKPMSVFHFGSMDWMPNEEAVLWFVKNAWPLVHRTLPEAKFYIVGRGMTGRVDSLDEPGVVVVGASDSADKVYHDYQVMVVPLLSGSGMRIKLVEGMAYGKAIVSTPVGAEGIPVQNGVQCLLAAVPADFARAVIELLQNGSRRAALQAEARRFAEMQYDNKKLVKQLLDFYANL
jgi:polysaccharide biosynthesis protein PslH